MCILFQREEVDDKTESKPAEESKATTSAEEPSEKASSTAGQKGHRDGTNKTPRVKQDYSKIAMETEFLEEDTRPLEADDDDDDDVVEEEECEESDNEEVTSEAVAGDEAVAIEPESSGLPCSHTAGSNSHSESVDIDTSTTDRGDSRKSRNSAVDVITCSNSSKESSSAEEEEEEEGAEFDIAAQDSAQADDVDIVSLSDDVISLSDDSPSDSDEQESDGDGPSDDDADSTAHIMQAVTVNAKPSPIRSPFLQALEAGESTSRSSHHGLTSRKRATGKMPPRKLTKASASGTFAVSSDVRIAKPKGKNISWYCIFVQYP